MDDRTQSIGFKGLGGTRAEDAEGARHTAPMTDQERSEHCG
jgi:hypothetical protein